MAAASASGDDPAALIQACSPRPRRVKPTRYFFPKNEICAFFPSDDSDKSRCFVCFRLELSSGFYSSFSGGKKQPTGTEKNSALMVIQARDKIKHIFHHDMWNFFGVTKLKLVFDSRGENPIRKRILVRRKEKKAPPKNVLSTTVRSHNQNARANPIHAQVDQPRDSPRIVRTAPE